MNVDFGGSTKPLGKKNVVLRPKIDFQMDFGSIRYEISIFRQIVHGVFCSLGCKEHFRSWKFSLKPNI